MAARAHHFLEPQHAEARPTNRPLRKMA